VPGAERAYDADTSWAVLPVSAALALYYLGLAALHHVVPDERPSLVLDVAAAVASLVAVSIAVAARRGLVPDYRGHLVMTFLVGLSTAYASTLLVVTRDNQESVTFVLVLVGAGIGLLRARWFTFSVLGVWVAWVACVAVVGGTVGDWDHWVFFMITATVLAVVVMGVRRRSIDVATAAIRRASQAATEDPATGLVNRRGLALLSREVLAVGRRAGDAVFCSFIDVDGLKAVNDRYGHDAGDWVILAVAQAIQATFRATDVLARWGGDEFVIVGLGGGVQPGELERRLNTYFVTHHASDTTLTTLRVSVGHAILEPWDEGDVERLLWVADRDMYARRALRGGHPSGIVTVDGTDRHDLRDRL
jgi:diguanylate cyclase (GGDEF)-like protein